MVTIVDKLQRGFKPARHQRLWPCRANRLSPISLLSLVLACSGTGCGPGAGSDRHASTDKSSPGDVIAAAPSNRPAEASFAEQLAAVRSGKSDELRLSATRATTNDLQALRTDTATLVGLRTLVLDAGVVEDSDVRWLTDLPGLQHLRLRSSPLTDSGLAELAKGRFDDLIILNLPQAKPTADGLKALGQLPRLRQLRIAGRQIDDQAIDVLAAWPSLTSLHLIQPSVTDRSLETIAGMSNLVSFYIDECPLSDQAWEKLFAARPKLHVHIDQAHHDLDPNADKH